MAETVNDNKKNVAPMLFSALAILAFLLILLIPASREIFEKMTASHPFFMGFIKFAVLATVGELIAIRLAKKSWAFPAGVFAKAIVWGLLGIVITLVFKIFAGGVAYTIALGLFPFSGRLFSAFLCSLLMNAIFAPTMMLFHKITDTVIEMKCRGENLVSLGNVVEKINFKALIGFAMAVTIPCFWIPAHTISFLLPGEYQIIMAASLSIALGIILSLKKN